MEFGRRFLKHYFACKSPAFHHELCDMWRAQVMKGKNPRIERDLAHMLCAKGRRIVITAPRGHAKSTVMSLQNVLHAAVYGYKKYILLISDTEYQSAAFLDAIKAEIELNEELIAEFGELKGKVWRGSSVTLTNGVRIDAVGTGQKLRGRRNGARRPDLIVLDDIENDEDVRSADQRERAAAWFFGAVSKSGDSYTDIIFIGTVLHRDCLLARLQANPAYRAMSYTAVEQFSSCSLWDEWRELYTDMARPDRDERALAFFALHRDEMLLGTQVLWPEKAPYYDLMCMMVSEGDAAFFREMQNEPEDPAARLFPSEWFRFYEPRTLPLSPEVCELYGYCDPSLGKSAAADHSAIITVAKMRESGAIYVLEADICRRHPDVIITDIIEKARHYSRAYGLTYTLFGAESNQFQWFLKERLAAESAKAGVYLPLKEVYARGDKTLRIQSLQPDIKNGYILFDRAQRELLDQLQRFPGHRHDDGPDALHGAVSLCKSGARLGTVSGLTL